MFEIEDEMINRDTSVSVTILAQQLENSVIQWLDVFVCGSFGRL